MVEHSADNRKVLGSSPRIPTSNLKLTKGLYFVILKTMTNIMSIKNVGEVA